MGEMERISSIVTRAAWDEAVAEAGAQPLGLSIGEHNHVGFLGTVAQYGLFILAARVRFGPYDAALVASRVRCRNTGGADNFRSEPDAPVEYEVDGQRGALRMHFYFPGLELY